MPDIESFGTNRPKAKKVDNSALSPSLPLSSFSPSLPLLYPKAFFLPCPTLSPHLMKTNLMPPN